MKRSKYMDSQPISSVVAFTIVATLTVAATAVVVMQLISEHCRCTVTDGIKSGKISRAPILPDDDELDF